MRSHLEAPSALPASNAPQNMLHQKHAKMELQPLLSRTVMNTMKVSRHAPSLRDVPNVLGKMQVKLLAQNSL